MINAKWAEYNRSINEGGEGYNPHSKHITQPARSTVSAARMVGGKMRTQVDAIKFANNCLSGDQRIGFLAEVKAAFAWGR